MEKGPKLAIVGMACRFPGANNIYEFWDNLYEGKSTITEIPSSRWDINKYYTTKKIKLNENKVISKWGGVLNDFEQFDAKFFNISDREAKVIDPQQRLLLQETWHCIEQSGVPLEELQKSTTSVFVGVMLADYQFYLTDLSKAIASHSTLGSFTCLLSNRLSHTFQLTGESETFDVACAGSLVALHKAKQSILLNESDFAVVAGVNIICHPWRSLSFSKLGMLSPDGLCKTFDITANGYVPAEGVGILLLASAKKMQELKLNCYGFVEGSAVNHNGHNRSITSPKVEAQTALIKKALQDAKLSAENISYIEAHGTGTLLGDPVEIEALNRVFTNKAHTCYIGSLKTNIGHLESASGIAGIIKVLLMMKHNTLIRTLNLYQENPLIDFKTTVFIPVLANLPWQGKKIAGISSFGFGGTNAHVIISEGIEQRLSYNTDLLLPLLISAKTEKSFTDRLAQYHQLLSTTDSESLPICATSIPNSLSPYRVAFLGENKQGLLNALDSFEDNKASYASTKVPIYLMVNPVSDNEFAQYAKTLPCINIHYERLKEKVNNNHLDNFIKTSAVYLTFMEMGISWSGLCCSQEAYLVCCLLSGMLSEDEVISLLTAENKSFELGIPKLSVIKDRQQLLSFLPKHLEQAIVNLHVADDTYQAILEEGYQLFVNNPTFNQLLMQWSDVLEQYNISLENSLNQTNNLTDNSRIACLMAVLVALRKFYKKWLISERYTAYPNILKLVVELVEQELLSPEDSIKIVLNKGNKDLTQQVVLYINDLLHHPIIHELVQQILPKQIMTSLDDLNRIASCDTAIEIHQAIVFNSNKVVEQIASLWQGGHDINWLKLFGPIPFFAINKPLYPFDTQPYWLTSTEEEVNNDNKDIAIIGFSGRFPGAESLEQFWQNLESGALSITEIPESRWSIDEFFDPNPKAINKSYSKWGGFLDNIDQFDPLFFNLLPAEAISMDPQQRLVLEESWKILEQAGYTGERLKGIKCGLYLGCMNNDYYEKILTDKEREITAAEYIGNANSICSARIAYYLDLKGPALTLDTACSSSMVCVHLACESLRSGTADLMLAGGVTLYLTETPYISMSKATMLSPVGLCKTFDNEADGFVPGEAIGFVLLKRLDDAVKDNDKIYGVIKGSGINQDGKSNGISAPNLDSQRQLIRSIYERYVINPDTIQYVETHGTGTKLGDPIEVSALTKAFGSQSLPQHSCALGALKSNIGHTSAASGVSALIKVLLCLQNKTLVPNVNFKQHNELIDFANSPFYVLTEKQPWKVSTLPRRAAVSSFGFSGTNAHLVIEEYLEKNRVPSQLASYLPFPISAKKEKLLSLFREALLKWLDKYPNVLLQDISYTLCKGRKHFEKRQLYWANSFASLKEQLTNTGLISVPADYLTIHESYLQQADVNWDSFFVQLDCKITPLPNYIFDRKSYWWNKKVTQDKVIPFTLPSKYRALTEHKVDGTAILPGATSLSFIQLQHSNYAFELNHIRFLRPIHSDDSKDLFLEQQNSQRLVVKSLSKAPHVTCVFAKLTSSLADKYLSIPSYPENANYEKSAIYERFHKSGLDYGISFQRIEKAFADDGYLYTKVSIPTNCQDQLHQATSFLDGILQIVLLFIPVNDDSTYVPYSIESWKCYYPLPNQVIVRAEQIGDSFNVIVISVEGKVLQEFIGVHLEKIASEQKEESQLAILVPYNVANTSPQSSNDTSILILDSFFDSLPLDRLSTISKIVVPLTGKESMPFNDKLHYYIIGLLKLTQTLQQINLNHHIILELRLQSESVIDQLLIRSLETCLKTISSENTKIKGQLVFDNKLTLYKELRPTRQLQDIFRREATYLITGGAGAVGATIALDLVERFKCDLILLGTSSYSKKHQALLAKIILLGGSASYHAVDCTDYAALSGFMQNLNKPIHGVLHCAGVLRGGFIKHKKEQDVMAVLKPKVQGTLNLDLLTKDMPLDFFVLTSSISSLYGIAGMYDYGYGNAFLNSFAEYRAQLVETHKRSGKSLAICWPHWNVGGLPLTEPEQEWLWQRYGFKSLTAKEGTTMFYRAVNSVLTPVCMVAKGDISKIIKVTNSIIY